MLENIIRIDFLDNNRHTVTNGMEAGSMRYEHLTLDRLKEMLDYDPATGVFRWKVRPHKKSRARPGDVAGASKKHPNGKDYRVIGIDGRAYQATQLAFMYVHGRWARGLVGQKDGNTADTRAENLYEMQTTADKHDLTTKEGRARYQRDYWDNNPGYRQNLSYKRYYGITVGQYMLMFNTQDGRCAICGKPETSQQNGKTRWLAVDHDHATGEVRALLCTACNSGLGGFRDNPELLEKATEYLRYYASLPLKRTA